MPQERKSIYEIQRILADVKYKDCVVRLLDKGDGFLAQWVFLGVDVDHPEKGEVLQHCRKWYVSPYSTTTEIVETAWKACWIAVQHETREEFTYKGERVYSPHFDIEARVQMCVAAAYDVRDPLQEKPARRMRPCAECGREMQPDYMSDLRSDCD